MSGHGTTVPSRYTGVTPGMSSMAEARVRTPRLGTFAQSVRSSDRVTVGSAPARTLLELGGLISRTCGMGPPRSLRPSAARRGQELIGARHPDEMFLAHERQPGVRSRRACCLAVAESQRGVGQ